MNRIALICTASLIAVIASIAGARTLPKGGTFAGIAGGGGTDVVASGTLANDKVVCGSGSSSVDYNAGLTCGGATLGADIVTVATSATVAGANVLTTSSGCAITGCSPTGTFTFDQASDTVDIATGTNQRLLVSPNGSGYPMFDKATQSSTAEIVLAASIQEFDDTKYGWWFSNGSSADGVLIPAISMYPAQTTASNGVVQAAMDDSFDTGTNSALQLWGFECTDGRGSTCSAIDTVTAHVIRLMNYTTVLSSFTAGGTQVWSTTQTASVSDSGGAGAATFNLDAQARHVTVTCSDTLGGCAGTIQETSAEVGAESIVCSSPESQAGTVTTFADVSNVFNAPSRVTTTGLGPGDCFMMVYTDASNDLWLVVGEDN